jgi:hypothetical protein
MLDDLMREREAAALQTRLNLNDLIYKIVDPKVCLTS